MVTVAVEQTFPEEKRLLSDDVAYRFLPLAGKAVVTLTRFPPARALLIGLSERDSPGIWGGMLRRKRYVDDKAIEGLSAGMAAVVNLGAGFDTRAYRLPSLRAVPVFEVDLPENIERKQAKLRQVFGRVPDHVTLVPIDFDRQDLAAVLPLHGHRIEEKTFFIWEGVTQYLTESGVRRIFDYLAKAQTGSRLVFTYVRKDFLDGTCLFGLSARSQVVRVKERLWRFGLAPDQVAESLAEYSWRELEQMGSREAAAWYPTPSGRTLEASETERAVYAEKT
jgi:methyltransferase (TIGR00027 family)